jgi:membrane associated rhomboid family serine protease
VSNDAQLKAERRRTLLSLVLGFMPFTPVGKDGGLRRPPVAVLGLIIVNVAVHLLAWPVQQADEQLQGRRHVQLAGVELDIERRYLGANDDRYFGLSISSRLRGRTAFEEKFWETFEAGRIVPEDHADYESWAGAHRAWREALEAMLYYRWGTHPDNGNPLSWLSAMFLHHGFWHLFGNMLILWVTGSALEDVWGPRFVLFLYLAAGLFAQVPDALFLPPQDVVGVGASGAVAGLMGAFLVKLHSQKLHFVILPMLPTVALPGWIFIVPWAWFEFRNATSGQFTGVAHWVHLGGLIGGGGVAALFRWGRAEEVAKASLAATDLKAAGRKRAKLAESAGLHEQRGDLKTAISDWVKACEADLGAHGDFDTALQRLVGSFDRERAGRLALDTLQALWQDGRKEEHARAFAMVCRHGLADTLPSIEWLHGTDTLGAGGPRKAAESLHAFLSARPEDPLAKAAMNRYADLLERLGHADAAADARARAASIKAKRS